MDSSSESDDNLLDAPPIFTTRRNTTRKKPSSSSFFDSLLDKEYKREKQDADEVVEYIKEEEEEEKDLDDNGTGVDGDGNENNATSDLETNTNMHDTGVTTSTNNNIDTDETTTTKPSNKATTTTTNKIRVISQKPKVNIHDPAYVKKIRDMSKSAQHNLMHRDKRKREIERELEGLNDEDVMGLIGYQQVPNTSMESRENGALVEEECATEIAAVASVKSMFYGARNVFLGKRPFGSTTQCSRGNVEGMKQPVHILKPFTSEDDAIQELEQILDETSTSTDTRLRSFYEPLRLAIDADLLSNYLQCQLMKSENTPEGEFYPFQILQWLMRTAYSGNNVGILQGISHRIAIEKMKHSQTPIFSLGEFISMLTQEFGLDIEPSKSVPESIKFSSTSQTQLENIYGLMNAMELWKEALNQNLVQVETEVGDRHGWHNTDGGLGTLALCIASVVRSGLDPVFQIEERSRVNMDLVNAFFGFAERKSRDFPTSITDWVHYTSELSLKLSMNISSDADSEDPMDFLPLSLRIRTSQQHLCAQKNESFMNFLGVFATLVAKQCLLHVEDFNEQVLVKTKELLEDSGLPAEGRNMPGTSTERYDNQEQFRYKILATAEVIHENVTKDMKRNGPVFITVMESSDLCIRVGIALFEHRNIATFLSGSNNEQCGMNGSTEEVNAISSYFERMEHSCRELKNSIMSSYTLTHLRRVKEILFVQEGFYRNLVINAKKANNGKKVKQETISEWLTRTPKTGIATAN